MLKTSIILASFQRPELLRLGLRSINEHNGEFPFEIIVVNDGTDDGTKQVCKEFGNLDIKYVFSGQRNEKELIWRTPAIANNIGIKRSTGDIVVLSCPEIWHLNNALDEVIAPLQAHDDLLTVPLYMYFDNDGEYLSKLKTNENGNLNDCEVRYDSVQMPFLMGVRREKLFEIGGYDEDFIGYAADDNDLVHRLQMNGCHYHSTEAKIVHLYHGVRNDSHVHWENPKWVYNYNLFTSRKHILVRNTEREWGKLDEVLSIL